MITRDGIDIRNDHYPSPGKFTSAMAEYLYVSSTDIWEEVGVGVMGTLCGKRILCEDNQSFVWVDQYDTAEEAEERFNWAVENRRDRSDLSF